jgi:hypothetical protein
MTTTAEGHGSSPPMNPRLRRLRAETPAACED